jgi:membrane-associated protease RseP (regulator of RpoE activity)
VGAVLFALGIAVSVALHECGHMWAAQATGMKVRRYFVGFGPKVFSWRRGETEYGLKALPLGGFCDIAGMTALDELAPDEVDRAMYRQRTWKRLTVMFAGIMMNFAFGFVLIVITAVGWGLPNLHQPPATALGPMSCVANQNADQSLAKCTGPGPAEVAGLRQGDVVTAVAGVPVSTWEQFVKQTQKQTAPFDYALTRDGRAMTIRVAPQLTQRLVPSADGKSRSLATVAAIGVGGYSYPANRYTPLGAVPGAAGFTGQLFVQTVHSLAQFPTKVGALWTAVTGGQRDVNTPISVVGATVIGGQTAERGLWQNFVLLLASLNFFLGVFNLLPLLPLDGGHIAVAAYERVRNLLRHRRGLPPGLPVDYLKLMPATYVVVVAGGLYMLLTLTADIVNPIKF